MTESKIMILSLRLKGARNQGWNLPASNAQMAPCWPGSGCFPPVMGQRGRQWCYAATGVDMHLYNKFAVFLAGGLGGLIYDFRGTGTRGRVISQSRSNGDWIVRMFRGHPSAQSASQVKYSAVGLGRCPRYARLSTGSPCRPW